jgi:hypothetical protein
MKINIKSEWQKTINDECFVLLENLSISNKIKGSENYEINGDISMVKLISDNKKLSVMYQGSLNNKKTNSAFMPPSAIKTLDFLRVNSNLVNSNRLQGDMSEYMHYRNWTNKNKAYNQIKRDLEFLSRIKMEYTGNHSFKAILLFGGEYGINSGKFFFF